MKFFKYILIWLCIVFLLSSVAGYVYIRLEGKRLFEEQLSKFFGQPATIKDVRYLVPMGIRLTDLEVQNVIEVEDVRLHLRIPFFLSGQFIIAKLELNHPVFHLVRYAPKQVDFGGVYLHRQEERFRLQSDEPIARVVHGIAVDLLSIQDGELMLVDLAASEPVKYHLSGIRAKALKIVYPLSDQQIRFDIGGMIRGAGTHQFLRQASFLAQGWINWPARTMDVTLDANQQTGLSAKLTLKGKDNQLQVRGRVEADVADESFQRVFKDVSRDGLGGVLLGAVQASQSKVGLNVNMDTQMDAFSLGLMNFQGEWQIPERRKEGQDRLNPAGLFGIIPAVTGTSPKK